MITEISAEWIGFLQTYAGVLQVMAVVTVVLIAISSIDDLFVDACFWIRALYRRLVIQPRHDRLTPAELAARPEQPLAIMVPAWREFDVIEVMVENAVRSFDYDNYTIFIGTYANDPETRSLVRRLAKRHARVVGVDLAQNGPTSKADCLNGIVSAIFQMEKTTGTTFAGMILHDCEDVVHPLELRFFNYLLPRKDLIQIPVVSLERGYGELIAGTYMDEFAEWHGKDLVVREAVARAVPSAGVGTCLSHKAMVALAEDHMEPFNIRSLTEDYDIAARLAHEGLSSIIAVYPVNYRVNRRSWLGLGPSRTVTLRMPLCVREYFPNTFRSAYRQKARWTLGISIQGWAQLGWSKSAKANYFLFRDRKALFTPSLALAGYFIVINYFLLQMLGLVQAGQLAPIFPDNRWIIALLAFNLLALVLRVVQRAWFVGKIYGVVHAALSFPRMVVGSVINFAASVRAVRLYVAHLLFGTPIAWDKTAHEFPTDDALAQDRRQLGAILLSWRAITEGELQDALAEQAQRPQKLGRILLSKGVLDDETLAEA
ncbi:MAG: glycosyl transferase family protein, partial [Brevundimonas sp.]